MLQKLPVLTIPFILAALIQATPVFARPGKRASAKGRSSKSERGSRASGLQPTAPKERSRAAAIRPAPAPVLPGSGADPNAHPTKETIK